VLDSVLPNGNQRFFPAEKSQVDRCMLGWGVTKYNG